MPVRVAVIQDHPRVQRGIGALLDSTAGVDLVGNYSSWESAEEELDPAAADVVVAEMHAPASADLDAVRRLKRRFPDMQILMLTPSTEVDGIFEAICAGVYGYLLKGSALERVVEAIRELHEGGAPMSPRIARRVLTMFQKIAPPRSPGHRLTPRELQVLRLLADGHSYKTAAAELNLGVDTARFHIRNIYDKLHVHSKSEAVLTAFRSGLLT